MEEGLPSAILCGGEANPNRWPALRASIFHPVRLWQTSLAGYRNEKWPRPFGRGHRLSLLWKKDSNLHGAVSSSAMCGGQPQSDPILVGPGITLCLSWIPTPETRGHVCQISSLHILAIFPGRFLLSPLRRHCLLM